MKITYLGSRHWDETQGCVRFEVLINGSHAHCAVGTKDLHLLCDEYTDALQAFDACRMVVLFYLSEHLSGRHQTKGPCLKIDFVPDPAEFEPRPNEIPFPPTNTPIIALDKRRTG